MKHRDTLITVTRGKTAITKTGDHALMVQMSVIVRCLVFEASNMNLSAAKLSECKVKNTM